MQRNLKTKKFHQDCGGETNVFQVKTKLLRKPDKIRVSKGENVCDIMNQLRLDKWSLFRYDMCNQNITL